MTVPSAPAHGPVGGFRVRAATARDATRISAFYEASYSSNDGRSASDNYAFPQILDPAWVESALEARMVSWLVAEANDRVIGAAGLLQGLGSSEDGIAECFGLAVERDVRSRGVGQRLLGALHETALREAKVAIGEMRTADPAAAQVVARSGFVAIGFEPFAHRVLGGDESMVAVAIISPTVLRQRCRVGGTTTLVRRLAELVLEPLDAQPLEVAGGDATPTVGSAPGTLRLKEVDAEVGDAVLRRLHGVRPNTPRFVDLRRMDELGRERRRRKQRYFAGIIGDHVVGCVHAAHNRHDYHLRIESFAWETPEVQEPMLRALVEVVQGESQGHPGVLVTEVAATDAAQQHALERAGFVPTAYCPALVVGRAGRLDVVQYTRLLGYTMADGLGFLETVEWPSAIRLVRMIAAALAERSRVDQRT